MQKRPVRHAETAYRSVGEDGGLVVLPARSEVKVLNPVGTKIYSMLDGKHTLDEIASAVVEEFDVGEEQARTDVQNFVANLRDEGLLAEETDSADEATTATAATTEGTKT